MSLITRCPNCQTLFRVVPDQLRISEGWVRCGQCNEIFDGNANLHKELLPIEADLITVVAAPEVPDALAEVDIELHGLDLLAFYAEPLGAVAMDGAMTDESSALSTDIVAFAAKRLAPDLPDSPSVNLVDTAEGPSNPTGAPVAIETVTSDDTSDSTTDISPVTFLRKMPETSLWAKSWVRAGLGLVALGLVAALAVQVVVQERDRISSLLPQARPMLVTLCRPLNCEVSPLRQIESIVIDSSSFSKTRGEAYHLALVVKNLASQQLAMPSFELTLTDSQDQPVLRRVLAPSDFGASASLIAAGSEWSTGLDVEVRAGPSVERFTGYRILAFYP